MSSLPDVLKHFDSSTEVSGLLQVLASGHWFYVFHLEITPPPPPPTSPPNSATFSSLFSISRRNPEESNTGTCTHTHEETLKTEWFLPAQQQRPEVPCFPPHSVVSPHFEPLFHLLSATFFPKKQHKNKFRQTPRIWAHHTGCRNRKLVNIANYSHIIHIKVKNKIKINTFFPKSTDNSAIAAINVFIHHKVSISTW